MAAISILILFPLIASILMLIIRNDDIRNIVIRVCATITGVLSLYVVWRYFDKGLSLSFENEQMIEYFITAAEIVVAAYILYTSIKHKKYLVTALVLIQAPLMLWFSFTQAHGIEVHTGMIVDKLSSIMVLVVGVIGSLITLYAVGYMKWYHIHHKDYKERKSFFFAVIFLFLSAMFGLVLSNNLTWIYFCWEITTLSSFLLIGYTRTKEATNNSFRALVINLGGGLAFALAIVIIGTQIKTLELSTLINLPAFAHASPLVLIPVFLLCFAALTKSAQIPFSSWLLGAMVAPTPTSALLHSATMVKAGVYLIIRLAPLLGASPVGIIITLVGGITFLVASLLAISQSDAKKILAYSTIANLGLIVTCASIGTPESIWAAILLVIFHAVSKSLLFLSVGAVEHQIGSRNVEDMDVLMNVSRKLSIYMLIGIAGMFLAPFGMLISKWAAMKAFIDSNNIIIILILVYGSAATLFYWTKWMGKLISGANRKDKIKHTFHIDEEIPIFIQAALTVIACFAFPLISKYALIPYLSTVFHVGAMSPIDAGDVTIMLIMLSMLILLPISFIPIYKSDKRRIVPIYMAGENTGDNETFFGSIGTKRTVELRNWYVEKYFGVTKLTFWSNIISIVVLCFGAMLLIGGFIR